MTVLSTWAAMRVWFASPLTTVLGAANNGSGGIRVHVATTTPIAFAGTGVSISGIVGTTEANGPWPVPTIVDATHIDLPGSTFSHAYASGGLVYALANDGLPAFPGPQTLAGANAGGIDNTGSSKLRASGFASSWTVTTQGGTVWGPARVGAIGPLIAGSVAGGDPLFPIKVSCNAGASDGGFDSFAWWLSQGVDPCRLASINTPATIQTTNSPQLFTVTQLDATHSGTVEIGVNASEVSKLFPGSGGVPPTDAGSLLTMFQRCALYVSRLSDRSYQWARLVDESPYVGAT